MNKSVSNWIKFLEKTSSNKDIILDPKTFSREKANLLFEQKILIFANEKKEFTASEVSDHLHTCEKMVRKILKEMIKKGTLQQKICFKNNRKNRFFVFFI